MAGTSPFPCQSPSFHSSSYLPKLEANFMRDFACCGNTLATLHDLLQHYEESHAQQTLQSLRTSSAEQHRAPQGNSSTPATTTKMASADQTPVTLQRPMDQPQNQQPPTSRSIGLPTSPSGANVGGIQLMRQQQQSQSPSPARKDLKPISDEMDGVDDMELDDAIGSLDDPPETPTQSHPPSVQSARQSLFGQQPRLMLNLNASGLPHSGLRTSQPPTPSSAGFSYQNNPTVSSVNTPTLSTHPIHNSQPQFSPVASGPGTPCGDKDPEFSNLSSRLNVANVNQNLTNMDYSYNIGADNVNADYCIDEPAKRLYSPNGFNNHRLQQQFAHFGISQAKNEALVQAHRAQQMMAVGNPHAAALMMVGEEHKPFRCPVIGCEKAYKNQNGLKYHKTHGHNTQQLHENGDGTFSIVNPETSTPYPGTLGMEKEKPYKCEVCSKRYKNLNGLKYHKQHSAPCNPDLKFNPQMVAAGLPLGMNMTGLPSIGTRPW